MYHIKNDKRARQSAELLYTGLMKCLERKPYDQITISDIQKETGIARSTFYRCFDNLSDILYWKCDAGFQKALAGFDAGTEPVGIFSEMLLIKHYFAYWIKNSDILSLLIKINRQDIIYACHMKNAESLRARFGELPGMDRVQGRYFMALRTGITISILSAWLQGGKKETAEDIMQILQTQFLYLGQKPHG